MTQTTFPKSFPPDLTTEAVFDTREEIACLVVGGTMSTRAAIRSKNDSSAEISDETEEREAEEDVLEGSEDA